MTQTIDVPRGGYTAYWSKRTNHIEHSEYEPDGEFIKIRIAKVTERFAVQRHPENPNAWAVMYTKKDSPLFGAYGGEAKTIIGAKKLALLYEQYLTDEAIEKYYRGDILPLAKARKKIVELQKAL